MFFLAPRIAFVFLENYQTSDLSVDIVSTHKYTKGAKNIKDYKKKPRKKIIRIQLRG
jgi:hypothetical protein